MRSPSRKTCGVVVPPDTARSVREVTDLPNSISSKSMPFSVSNALARVQCGHPRLVNSAGVGWGWARSRRAVLEGSDDGVVVRAKRNVEMSDARTGLEVSAEDRRTHA